MLFIPQGSASVVYLFTWLCVLYIGWSLWTISHTSWALELSRDYDRRSRITGLLQVFSMLGGIVMALIPAIMERVSTPTYDEKTAAIGWFMIVLLPLTAILCLASLPERQTPNRPHLGFRRGAALVFGNMPLLRVLVANATLGFSWVLLQALFVFFVTYALGLQDWLGLLLTCLIVGGLLFLPVWVKLSQSWHKHGAMQAAMITATARFAKLSGAKVVPFFQERLEDGSGYALRLYPALQDFPSDDDVTDATSVNTVIENEIRKFPEQYLWVHRRFKTRPKGEDRPYIKAKKKRTSRKRKVKKSS